MDKIRQTQIWKFKVNTTGDTELQMPAGARVIHVAGNPTGLTGVYLWAIVDPATALETRRFKSVGTGFGFDEFGLEHLGTAICGAFVWHVFEQINVR